MNPSISVACDTSKPTKQRKTRGPRKANPLPTHERGLFDYDAAIAYLSIGRTNFCQLVREGVIPRPIKLGGRSLWARATLDQFIRDMADERVAA